MDPTFYNNNNPLLLSQPIATSSPTISFRATNYPQNNNNNSSSDNLWMSRYHKSNFICDQSSNEDIPKQNLKYRHAEEPKKLNKSMSSPAFGNFRSVRRKQSEGFASSMENVFGRKTTTQQQQQTTTRVFCLYELLK